MCLSTEFFSNPELVKTLFLPSVTGFAERYALLQTNRALYQALFLTRERLRSKVECKVLELASVLINNRPLRERAATLIPLEQTEYVSEQEHLSELGWVWKSLSVRKITYLESHTHSHGVVITEPEVLAVLNMARQLRFRRLFGIDRGFQHFAFLLAKAMNHEASLEELWQGHP